MPGEFLLTGAIDQFMLGSPTAEQLAALTGLTITLKSNIPPSQGLPVSGGLFYVPQRTVTVLSSGQISEDGTNNGIMLLANDTTLGLTNAVQWTLHPGRVTLGGKQIKLATWTFQAPAPGVNRTLDQLAPVPNIPAVPVTTFGADQITGATTFGKNLLFLADAPSARTYFGISGSGAEWESYVNLAAFPVTGNINLEYVAQDTGKLYRWNSGTSAYVQIADKAAVGLGNVDNTSDANKPVSTAQQTALDLKAPLASPAFTGTPTGITKAHVGLGNADNTSDVNKPVSTAQAAADAAVLASATAADTTVLTTATGRAIGFAVAMAVALG